MSQLLDVTAAQEKILAHAKATATTEKIALINACHRVLAEDVRSTMNVPPFHNSAMDGYAFRFCNLDKTADSTTLPVSQYLAAGVIPTKLNPGTAARIFTGGVVPSNADTVVMQENCEASGDQVIIKQHPAEYANIRKAGEDIQQGEIILTQGTSLTAAQLGLLASVGISDVLVFKPLRIGLLSTGNEIIQPGDTLTPGKIYNSNHYFLTGLLQQLHCEIIDSGNVSDEPDELRKTLLKLAETTDIIISTGGVSVGDKDYVKNLMEDMGRLELWRVNLKPGKPIAFGYIQDTPIFGLPGNPVSAYVTFLLFARRFILATQGCSAVETPTFQVRADFDWQKPCKREEYLRARYHADGTATLYPKQGSGVLSSVAWANGLIKVPPQQTIAKGDSVTFIPSPAFY